MVLNGATPQSSALLGELAAIGTLPALFAWRVRTTPRAEAYRVYDEAAAQWRSVSWSEAGARVDRFAAALTGTGLPRGARVAILLVNGLDAVCADQAALAIGCVPVPLHALDNAASIAYILGDSDASILITGSEDTWRAILATEVALPALRDVVVVTRSAADGAVGIATVPVRSLDDWLARGGAAAGAGTARAPAPQELAALVYTSGTTGRPKGVMLTHDNVVSNVKAVLQRVEPTADDVFLSFLPLSHTFERTAGYYLPIAAGSCVAFARSVALLSEDFQTVRPTVLISVPRIYERAQAGVQAALAGHPVNTWLFDRAQNVGWRRFCRAQGLAVPGGSHPVLDAVVGPVLDRLVGRTLRRRFGGRLRVAVSGGAPLSSAVARCFLGLGLPIAQGYGMTETSPVVAANTPEDNDPGTVGRVLDGVQVRLGENGELQVRGPNVMRGYWKRDDDTARAFVDGWLRTGDQAAVQDGRLRIVGRVKDIIVTSTGEKIAPVDLEGAIVADPLFEQAYVFGDNRPFIGCIVVLGRAPWQALAARLGLDPADPASLQAAPAREAALQRIQALTSDFPHYAQPRATMLTLEAWTTENSLLTPTLKPKRNNLAAHFSSQIDRIYRR